MLIRRYQVVLWILKVGRSHHYFGSPIEHCSNSQFGWSIFKLANRYFENSTKHTKRVGAPISVACGKLDPRRRTKGISYEFQQLRWDRRSVLNCTQFLLCSGIIWHFLFEQLTFPIECKYTTQMFLFRNMYHHLL